MISCFPSAPLFPDTYLFPLMNSLRSGSGHFLLLEWGTDSSFLTVFVTHVLESAQGGVPGPRRPGQRVGNPSLIEPDVHSTPLSAGVSLLDLYEDDGPLSFSFSACVYFPVPDEKKPLDDLN